MPVKAALYTIRILERATYEWQPIEPVFQEAMTLVAPGKALRRYAAIRERMLLKNISSVRRPEPSDSGKIASGARSLVTDAWASAKNAGHIEIAVIGGVKSYRYREHKYVSIGKECPSCGWSLEGATSPHGTYIPQKVWTPPVPEPEAPESVEDAQNPPQAVPVPVAVEDGAGSGDDEDRVRRENNKLKVLFAEVTVLQDEVEKLRARMLSLEGENARLVRALTDVTSRVNAALEALHAEHSITLENRSRLDEHQNILRIFGSRAERRSG